MKVLRWPAVVLIFAAIVGLIVADRDPSTSVASVAAAQPVGIAVAGTDSLASTWFCAAGTATPDGIANQTLLLANPTGRNMMVSLTLYPVSVQQYEQPDLSTTEDLAELVVPPPAAQRATPVSETIEIDANTTAQVDLQELAGIDQGTGTHVAAAVEADWGGLVVVHQVKGPQGASVAPCHTTASSSWTLAAGTTRRGARQFITLFNPFPTDAVADIAFAVDGRDRGRAPQVYRKVVIPAQSVLPVEITSVVTLFDSISTSVDVVAGRLVVDRIVEMTPTEVEEIGTIEAGLSLGAGSASLASEWVFPVTHLRPGVADALVIYNPSDEEARVSVEVFLDQPALNGAVEPFGLNIGPGSTEIVVLVDEGELVSQSRVIDGSSRIPAGVGYWAAVRTLNDVGISAERMTVSETDQVATSFTNGSPLAGTTNYLLGSGADELLSGELVVVNPSDDAIATVRIDAYLDRERFKVITLEVAASGRTLANLDALGVPADALLVFTSTEPVVVEADLSIGGAGRVPVRAIPSAQSAVAPGLPI